MKIGFLGGGQLAKMSALAAFQHGISVAVFDVTPDSPLFDLTPYQFVSDWSDRDSLKRFAESVDIIALENEFVDPEILLLLESLGREVVPNSYTISKIQDKLVQKKMLVLAGLPATPFSSIESEADAYQFGEKHGYPFILKARKQSYDGYGNRTVSSPGELKEKMLSLGFPKRKIYVEKFVDFVKEIATITAKDETSKHVMYPLVETFQENHICKQVKVPVDISKSSSKQAIEIVHEIMNVFLFKGLLAVEMFVLRGGQVLVNELAPRPHNSAHYSIDACSISQFETLVRILSGFPLVQPKLISPAAVMVNILGKDNVSEKSVYEAASKENVRLHLYGKKVSKKGRKMGHLTVLGNNVENCLSLAQDLEETISL